jgi:hypothetical protein
MGYPLDLEELVEGVEVGDPQSPDSRTVRFLAKIPTDPFTELPEGGCAHTKTTGTARRGVGRTSMTFTACPRPGLSTEPTTGIGE